MMPVPRRHPFTRLIRSSWNITNQGILESITDVNRNALSDSKLSLDTMVPIADSAIMIAAQRPHYAERRDAARNMARFYALSIEPTLFGDVCLTRRWGRIGTRGQMRAMSFSHEEEALAQFAKIQRQKASRGYRECLT